MPTLLLQLQQSRWTLQSQLPPAALAGAVWDRFWVTSATSGKRITLDKRVSLCTAGQSLLFHGPGRNPALGQGLRALPTQVRALFSQCCVSGSSTMTVPHCWRHSCSAPATKREGLA